MAEPASADMNRVSALTLFIKLGRASYLLQAITKCRDTVADSLAVQRSVLNYLGTVESEETISLKGKQEFDHQTMSQGLDWLDKLSFDAEILRPGDIESLASHAWLLTMLDRSVAASALDSVTDHIDTITKYWWVDPTAQLAKLVSDQTGIPADLLRRMFLYGLWSFLATSIVSMRIDQNVTEHGWNQTALALLDLNSDLERWANPDLDDFELVRELVKAGPQGDLSTGLELSFTSKAILWRNLGIVTDTPRYELAFGAGMLIRNAPTVPPTTPSI